MLVVVDASVLVQALTKFDDEGEAIRSWLLDLAGSEQIEILKNLTHLEFLNALRSLCYQNAITPESADRAISSFLELPASRREVTQPMARRIWELRNNVTAYDAAYVALVERLQGSQRRPDVVLATLDAKLAHAPTVTIECRLFPGVE